MITMNLITVCKARGIIYPHAFLVRNGIPANVATRLTSGNHQNIRLEHIEKLCRALTCEPSDLFRFQSHPNESLPKDHPLLKLQNDKEIPDLSNMPYKQLLEITKKLGNS